MSIAQQLLIMTAGWKTVKPPAAFTWDSGLTIQRRGSTFRVKQDLSRYAPTGKTYYVKRVGGADGNSGANWDNALQTVKAAIAKADAIVIRVAAGLYEWEYGVDSPPITKDLAIVGDPGAILSYHFHLTESWALDGVLTNTWKATRSNVTGVRDASREDAHGDYEALTLQASAADVDANPGSWYLDGSNVLWVRTADDREPDADIRAYFAVFDNVGCQGAVTLYLENLQIHGGGSCLIATTTAGPNAPTVYAKNCDFKYGQDSDAVHMLGGTFVGQGCVAAASYDDGFNYHANNGFAPRAMEIDCIGRDNGAAGDIDNGSTIHDAGSVIRVNGEYMRNVGRNIHDITASTKSWNLGCYAHDGASVAADINWAVGNVDAATMWLDRCRSTGSGTDLEVQANATMYIRRVTDEGNRTVNGTLATY